MASALFINARLRHGSAPASFRYRFCRHDEDGRSIALGAEPNPAEPPLEIYRGVSHLKIYLPVGSSEGDYDIQISRPDRKMLFAAKGTAIKQQGVMYVAAEIDYHPQAPVFTFSRSASLVPRGHRIHCE